MQLTSTNGTLRARPFARYLYSNTMVEVTIDNVGNSMLACHTWVISRKLQKIANDFPKSAQRLQKYAKRLQAASKEILSISSNIMTFSSRPNQAFVEDFLRHCHGHIKLFHALHEVLRLSGNESGPKPYLSIKGKPLAALEATSAILFEDTLSMFEEISSWLSRS